MTRFGGVALVLSGGLYLVKALLDYTAGDPPSDGTEIIAWSSSHEVALAWTDEVFFAVTVLLIPGVIALYRALDGPTRPWVGFGCGVIAAVIPTLFAVLMVHGRLAFPIYDITLDDPASARLVVTVYYGGMHAVSLLVGGAAVVLGLAMRGGALGPGVGIVGVAAGVGQFAVAYPWLLAPSLVLILQAVLALWFALMGWRLARRP